jgi:hypothetical protein
VSESKFDHISEAAINLKGKSPEELAKMIKQINEEFPIVGLALSAMGVQSWILRNHELVHDLWSISPELVMGMAAGYAQEEIASGLELAVIIVKTANEKIENDPEGLRLKLEKAEAEGGYYL